MRQGRYDGLSSGEEKIRTLDTDVYVVLRLLGFASVFVGLGERVCGKAEC